VKLRFVSSYHEDEDEMKVRDSVVAATVSVIAIISSSFLAKLVGGPVR
jgi:hypothetical protein